MKIKNIKNKILLIVILIFFVNLPLFLYTNDMKEDVSTQLIRNLTERNGQKIPKLSYTATIPYQGYIYAWNGVYINDDLDWEFWNFEGQTISVYVMDDTNFAIFDSGGSASGWVLSDGTHTSDSGTWSPSYSDTWYIVYHHTDSSDTSSVTLTANTYFPIEVTSPTDSSSWQEGTTHTITWLYRTCTSSYVSIDLYRYGAYIQSVIPLSYTTNDGSYSWTIPSGFTYGSGYQIRVEDYYYPDSHGYSEAYFDVTAPDSLTITYPTGSSSWQAGVSHQIQWSSTGSISSVDIDLYRLGSWVRDIVDGTSNDGSYWWMIPTDLTYYDDTYQIHIEDSSNPSTDDESTAYFEITPPDSITITGPTAGSEWLRGTNLGITWTTTGSISSIDIDIMKDVTLIDQVIGTTNDGSYNWPIPGGAAVGDDWWVILYDNANALTYDNSDDFSIVRGTLTVTAPISSDSWQAGSTQTITWSSTGSIPNVGMELYHSGSYYAGITTGTTNDGSFSWTLDPSYTYYDDNYQVVVYDTVYPSVTHDFSDAYFEITAPSVESITVTGPLFGSTWLRGTNLPITWTSTGSITSVDIDIMKDVTLMAGIVGTPNDGSYDWSIPSGVTPGDDWWVIVYDNVNAAIYDFSDDFSIVRGILTVTSPTSSDSWQAGSTQTITWSSTGSIPDVGIELYHSGSYYATITTSTPEDGSYSWTLDSSYTFYDDTYQIVVYDNVYSSLSYDFSDAFFEITSLADSITVTGPLAGSSWANGTDLQITWTTTGSIASIDIDIMKDITLMDQVIGTPNDGAYDWFIPGDAPLGDDWWVILYDNANAATYDFSDDFEIGEATSITLTSPIGGESWAADTTHAITWTWTGSFSDVEIRLYSGATLVDTLASSTPNDGSYSWHISEHIAPGVQYWIAIIQVGGLEVVGISGDFSITNTIAKSITISNPTESSSWDTGTTEIISWDWTGYIPYVDIILAKGSGESVTIEYDFYGITNIGDYSWNIPSDAKNGDDWNLFIYDNDDELIYDAVIGFEIISEVVDGDGRKPLIPGYSLILLIVSFSGVSVLVLRKKIKNLART